MIDKILKSANHQPTTQKPTTKNISTNREHPTTTTEESETTTTEHPTTTTEQPTTTTQKPTTKIQTTTVEQFILEVTEVRMSNDFRTNVFYTQLQNNKAVITPKKALVEETKSLASCKRNSQHFEDYTGQNFLAFKLGYWQL